MIVLLLVLINILALYAILAKDLMQGVLALAGLSLFSTLLFYIFHAPDVAITEAAVGTGVSTVIFVWAIRSTDSSAENRKPRKYYRIWENILSMVIAGIVLPAVFLMDTPWPVYARNYLEQYGVQETGAQNLVSSIYLDYRLIDTLGETIVLLAAISGTIALMHSSIKKDAVSPAETASAAVPSRASGPKSTGRASLRTVLMQVAAGKLGPVVLLFGMYVMFFGHLSPGGGFQGGVVTASGIIFLALGSREHTDIRLFQPRFLARMEAVAFLMFIMAFLTGMEGTGLFRFLPLETSIILMNLTIGLKVGSGVALMILTMMRPGEK